MEQQECLMKVLFKEALSDQYYSESDQRVQSTFIKIFPSADSWLGMEILKIETI